MVIAVKHGQNGATIKATATLERIEQLHESYLHPNATSNNMLATCLPLNVSASICLIAAEELGY